MTAGLHDIAVKACVMGGDEVNAIKQRPEFRPEILECWLASHVIPGDAMNMCEHEMG